MKKSFIAGLAGTLVLGLATSAFAFTDVTSSHWAQKYVDKLAELKVVNGVSETAFNPNGKVTRAEFAKLIVEAKGLSKENPAKATFSDVAADKWYYGYVEAAAKAGYVNGTGEGKFDPNANVTRQEIAKIIVEAAGLKADATKTLTFADAADVSEWAKGYVAVAAENKFVEGYNNKFSPKNNATRAEAAKLTYSEMVYEGKIVDEVVVPAGYMKVTDTPAANATEIELNDEAYTVDNDNYKIAGVYTDDAQVFIEGSLVKVTFNDDDEILSLEADPKVVKGEVNGLGKKGDDRTVTIGDTEVVWVDADDYDPAFTDTDVLTYADIAADQKLIVLLNEEGLGYAALEADSVTAKGELTAVGVTADDEYYFIVDGKKYYTEDDAVGASPAVVDFVVYTNNGAAAGTTYAALTALMEDDAVAELEIDAKGKVTKVTAFAKEITATPIFTNWAATTYVFDGKKYENIINLGAIAIGEKAVTATPDTYFKNNFRPVDGAVKVTVNGATVDYADLDDEIEVPADYTVTATINAEGEVVELVFTDETIFGQISAFVENTKDEITKITIGDKQYTLDTKLPDTLVKKGYVVKGTVQTDGELAIVETVYQPVFESGSLSKFQQFKVVATRFEEGLDPTDLDDSKSFVTGAGEIRVQNVDNGSVFTITAGKYIKGAVDVKLSTVKIGDTIVLVDDASVVDAAYKYAVISPITTNK